MNMHGNEIYEKRETVRLVSNAQAGSQLAQCTGETGPSQAKPNECH
jgi:hypothetical protein